MKTLAINTASLRAYLNHLTALQPKLDHLLTKVRGSPKPEVVHQTRVTLRQIRTALYLAKLSDKSLAIGKIDLELKSLSSALSDLRELNVAIQNAKIFHVTIPQQELKLQRARRKIKVKLNRQRQIKILRKLTHFTQKIKLDPALELKKGLKGLRKKMKPLLHHAVSSDEKTHQFRLKMKKVRYSLEMINCPQAKLVELQRHLGRVCDLASLERFSGKNEEIEKQKEKEKLKAESLAPKAIKHTLKLLKYDAHP